MRKLHENQRIMKTNKLFMLILLLLATQYITAQFALGDIAFSAYNSDTATPDDSFTIVLLRDVTSGEAITFTENGWFAHLGGFRSGESTCTLTFGSNYPAGTQVIISRTPFQAVDKDNNSVGTMSGSGLNLATGGDSILAYDAASLPTTSDESGFVAGINMTGEWRTPDGMDSTSTTERPATLIDGTHAVSIEPEIDNARYAAANCSVATTVDGLRTALNTATNWETDNGTAYTQVPPVCDFIAVLSTLDHDLEATMQLYPNPVEELLYIRSDSSSDVQITVYDLSGKQLIVSTERTIGSLDMSSLTTGIYFVEIKRDQRRMTQKIVKL